MIHWHSLGRTPQKHHIVFRDEDGTLLMEQMVTREGFHGPYSILYFRTPPTDEFSVETLKLDGFCPVQTVSEQPLHRRHVRTQDLKPKGDFLTGRRTLMLNSDIEIGLCKPSQPAERFFSNGDGDECWFVKEGTGRLESVYGILSFREHDYLLIPRSTPYRLHLDGNRGTLLVFEGRPRIGVPSEFRNACGQLTDYAPFSHRDFRVPRELLHYDPQAHGKGPFPVVVKLLNELTMHNYQHFPFDVVGWDGALYPVAFNIHDYQPKTGQVHLPPTIHTTFAGNGFVICSFVPRVTDTHPQAIPCPYGHASIDMDEILYYVRGNFTSRRGIESESISLHPQGVPHGPHPGAYQASIGTRSTDELAVMMDCYKPLRLTSVADGIEDKDYHTSWVRREQNPMIS